MKKILVALIALVCAMTNTRGESACKAVSPDGTLAIILEEGAIRVEKNSVKVVGESKISLSTDAGEYVPAIKPRKVRASSVDRTLSPILYQSAKVRDNYNETVLSYKGFDIILRAYDDAAAYRFVSKSSKSFRVLGEKADFAFPEGTKAFVPYVLHDGDFRQQLNNSFENQYVHIPLCDWNRSKLAFLPITFESGGYNVCITESDLLNFPGLMFSNTDGDYTLETVHAPAPAQVQQGGYHNIQGIVTQDQTFIAQCGANEAFPWRIFAVADNPAALVGSDIVYKLATPADTEKDWSWVKPGKVAWDWWNDWNLKGVDFVAGINTATYKFYIDFASANKIEYVILDEGWSTIGTANLYDVIPEIDLEQLISYADSKGVGLILWGGYMAFQKDMDSLMKHYSEMGIKGFKIDFMDRDDQQMVNFYVRAAQTAAKYHMFVDFHGAYKPTGLHRTYPNVINYEGVHGLEQMKWSDASVNQVEYDVTIPFIRMVAGPFDYTQGAMRNASRSNYTPVNSEPMSQGTRCHQLAEFVIFDSPFSMLCDSPSNYLGEPECTKFISEIPTVWDETFAIDGKIAEYVAMGRRSGNTWYVGALSNWTGRDLTLDISFLPEGNYDVTIYRDGANADKAARDFKITSDTMANPKSIDLHLASGGGWVAKFTKK